MADQDDSINVFEITSEYMSLDANKKAVLTLNQKKESASIAAKETTIECKDKITLKCGSSSIEISSSSVTIKANSITIKSDVSSVELSSRSVDVKSMSINLG
ncbi:hypothetical protein [Francisella sp. SYW-9]|uniref:hypothetical protein n=1 Tax=Francisella sp. SYW-9 TaxID=2610888 RepID=UPI00123DAD28|nr:hypothetical protein [Francisella sp. SYW-9]